MSILEVGEKVHVVEKRRFAEDVRRHFVGEVLRCTESALRIKGYVWVYNSAQSTYIRHTEVRERVISLEGDLIINLLPRDSVINDIKYIKDPIEGLVVAEGKRHLFAISEFGPK